MSECSTAVFSNDYYDLIIQNRNREGIPRAQAVCTIPVQSDLELVYLRREGLPPINVQDYTYSAIPTCFSALDTTALGVAGILQVQNQIPLQLTGQGILIGFIDTGIEYQNPVFIRSDGSSRIRAIWDQTVEESDRAPEGFFYGREYTNEELNTALQSENPLSVVPATDTSGHGTFVASVAAGNTDYARDFTGAAPLAEIAMVKLKRAKEWVYDFWHIPKSREVYQENDIMLAAAYLARLAEQENKPFVLCITVGSNMGSHAGDGPLAELLSEIGTRRQHAVVIAAGNEALERHHFSNDFSSGIFENREAYQQVEISVGENVQGFILELWANAPELFSIALLSPTGEQIPRIQGRSGEQREFRFVYENTVVSVDYRIVGSRTARQLIFVRFTAPTKGLWNIFVYPDSIIDGRYDVYLPMTEHLSGSVFFIRSNPNETITIPGGAPVPMTTGGYDAKNNGVYINSGRGFAGTCLIKPDYASPAVNVYGAGLRNQFEARTGTSGAAAIAAGAVALFMEWAIGRGNERDINSVDIKNYFLRGAKRSASGIFPNREVGYGVLDLSEVFNKIRIT